MNYREVFEKLCEYAPIELSDKLVALENGYDNSGIIVGNTGDIEKILFCLDLTGESVKAAIEKGVNLIVTHHPAIYNPLKSISENSALYNCVKNNVAVISMHLNLDCAKTGVDYCLAEGLGGKITEILTPLGENCPKPTIPLMGYSKDIKPFSERIKARFTAKKPEKYA